MATSYAFHHEPGQSFLKAEHERDEVIFFLDGQIEVEHQIEEFDGVMQRRQPAIVKVGWRVFDAAQRERLDRPFRTTDVEPFDL